MTQPNSLITWGWGFSFFINSSSDRRSFLSEVGAFAKGSTQKSYLIFHHNYNFITLNGNLFAAVTHFQCSLSAWYFLFCLYQNHHLNDVLLNIVYWPWLPLDLNQAKSLFISRTTLNYITPLSIFTATVKLSWLPCKLFTVASATCEKAPLPMTLTMLTFLRLISQLLVEGWSGM